MSKPYRPACQECWKTSDILIKTLVWYDSDYHREAHWDAKYVCPACLQKLMPLHEENDR